LLMLAGAVLAGNSQADNWTLVESKDGYWIKTVNEEQHELLVAYYEKTPHFLLILKTASPPPGDSMQVSLKIDRGPRKPGVLSFLEKRPQQSIARIEFKADEKSTYLSQMIAGLTLSVYFEFPDADRAMVERRISFSLKGFTVALNDLLIANEAGSLDPTWLLQHGKDRELYCLLATDISVRAMQYRLRGESYKNVLHLIPETGYSVIDHNFGEIIEQVYRIPLKEIPYVPRAEKYLMYKNCMRKSF